MTTDQPEYGASRAILIGVSEYDDAGFTPLQAAHNSLNVMQTDMADQFWFEKP